MKVIGTPQAKGLKHITEMAYCCGFRYRRWRFEGKTFRCGHKHCQHDHCAICRKPIKYSRNFQGPSPTKGKASAPPRRQERIGFGFAETFRNGSGRSVNQCSSFIREDDRPREGGRVMPMFPG